MSDILSPFLVVFPNSNALAYMCFSALMNKIRQNFLEGQPGVHISIQHIGSLLQHVDKKLWRQIGNDSFIATGQCQQMPSSFAQFKITLHTQQSVSRSILLDKLLDKSFGIAVLHGHAFKKSATGGGGSSLTLGMMCPLLHHASPSCAANLL